MREMKDSGVEWLGTVPSTWKLVRAKTVFSQRNEKGNNEAVLLSATQLHGMYPQELIEGVVQTREDTDLQSFKTVHKNDFVISLRSFQGGFEISDYEGVCSPAYQVFHAIKPVDYRYYKKLFKSDGFISKMNSLTVGIREGKNILYSDFASSIIPVPPVEEQAHIADYLDRKCSAIDTIIAKQEQIIERLKAYKLSLITEAVTKGLDPNVEIKDSGVEWIGQIPTTWKVGRIKYNYYLKGRIGWQGLKADEFIDEGPYLVTGTDFCEGKVNWSSCYHISEERYEEAPEIHVELNDLLITKDGTVGKVAFINEKPEKVSLNSHLLIMRPLSTNYYNKYLFWVIQSSVFDKYFLFSQNGTIMASLSQEKINDFSFALPSVLEQKQIVEYLDGKCEAIENSIKRKNRIIQELKEYKKSLIYEVVTGKKEV